MTLQEFFNKHYDVLLTLDNDTYDDMREAIIHDLAAATSTRW